MHSRVNSVLVLVLVLVRFLLFAVLCCQVPEQAKGSPCSEYVVQFVNADAQLQSRKRVQRQISDTWTFGRQVSIVPVVGEWLGEVRGVAGRC